LVAAKMVVERAWPSSPRGGCAQGVAQGAREIQHVVSNFEIDAARETARGRATFITAVRLPSVDEALDDTVRPIVMPIPSPQCWFEPRVALAVRPRSRIV
jgi:hypothetical protein